MASAPAAPNGYTPTRPRAEVLAKRTTAASEAKKATRQAAAPPRCECGKQFRTKDALKQHRKTAAIHQKGAEGANKNAGGGDAAPNVACDCGKVFRDAWDMRRHRYTAKEHALPKPFAESPAMVLMRPLSEVGARLAGVLEESGLVSVTERFEGGDDQGPRVCVLCECGRCFEGWPELYAHLRGGGVHKACGQLTVYSGLVYSKKREKEVQASKAEVYTGMDGIRVKGVEDQTWDVICTCEQAFKSRNALLQHQRDSPKHKWPQVATSGSTESHNAPQQKPTETQARPKNTAQSTSTEAEQHGSVTKSNSINTPDVSNGSKPPRADTKGPNDTGIAELACRTCNRVFKHNVALADHQRNSTKHRQDSATKQTLKSTSAWEANAKSSGKSNQQRKKSSRSGGGNAFGGYGYTRGFSSRDYYSSYGGYGGGEDYSICDKDCGWCGHCMDGVDVF